jgi:hypothetical protein
VLRKKFSERTDGLQFVFTQTAQLFLTDSAFIHEPPKHVRKSRIPIVVLEVDLFTAFAKVLL